ncbi:MAG TPA: ATP-binding cassette domain-containing protein [Micromonosporaceae bacterium]|nr:ATP-binding cassette domain-containing protein [Micromonosporaceae bacterium]
MDRTPPAPNAATITLDGVGKRYDDGTVAVKSLSLEVPAGELVALIGPSGCGKSTILRMINRLIEPTSGKILLNGDDITTADAVELRRKIGYVIQHVGLFPHQTIAANTATVPRLLGWPKERTRARVNELLELVGLDPSRYGNRYPSELSGGQNQRVGVARALAADPAALLMDEPFSAVDPIVRVRLQDEFLRLQRTVRKTIVFVTHDLDEAVRLADRIVVLSEHGVLEQFATPAALLSQPANAFVREFIGADRGIKRLRVTAIDPKRLAPVSTVDDVTSGPSVTSEAMLSDALAALLDGGHGWVSVTDPENGEPIGILTATAIAESGAVESPAPPAADSLATTKRRDASSGSR